MVKKPIREFELRNIEADDFINQAKGLRAVKRRKRFEKSTLNYFNPGLTATRVAKAEIKFEAKTAAPDELVHKLKMHPLTKITDQIQRGFNIATKWRNEDVQEES